MARFSPRPKRFLTPDERAQVVAAIAAAEARTSGEIRVYLEHQVGGGATDAYVRARQVFAELGMHATAERNGVLIYLAVAGRRLALVGDEALHRHVGQEFWDGQRDRLVAEWAAGRAAAGLCACIAAVGARLSERFPPRPEDRNELPDDLAGDA